MKKFRLNKLLPSSKRLLTYSAIIISICALGTTAYQTYILKQQQHAAVWPRLSIFHSWNITSDTGVYRLSINNNGIGPALIDEVKIIHRNTEVRDFAELSRTISDKGMLPDNLTYENYSDLLPNMVIPQQDEIELLSLANKLQVENFLRELKENVQVIVRYSSLYGRRYEVTYPTLSHKEID